MRKRILVSGFVLFLIGGILIIASTFPVSTEVVNHEEILHVSQTWENMDDYEYDTRRFLLSEVYEFNYILDTESEDLAEFEVRILDPDGIEIMYFHKVGQSGVFTFKPQKIGEHIFQFRLHTTIFNGWLSKITMTAETNFPYETALYPGVVLLIAGAITCMLGTLHTKT